MPPSTLVEDVYRFNQGTEDLSFIPTIGNIPIEKKIKDSLIDRAHDFDWTITWNALKQVQHFKCTSSRRNVLWAFMIEILNNMLPVGQILKKCPMCNMEEENINRVKECKGTKAREINSVIFTQLRAFIRELLHNNLELNTNIINIALNILMGTSEISDEFDSLYYNALQGKMDLTLSSCLRKTLKITREKTITLCTKILIKIVTLIKVEWWLPRCEMTVQ